MQAQTQCQGALVDLEDFLGLIEESRSYELDRQGEVDVWRADHPALGQIVGIQGAMSGVLVFQQNRETVRARHPSPASQIDAT